MRPTPLVFVALIACAGGASPPAPSPVPAGRVVLSDSAVVPIEIDREGRPVVRVSLNGRGPYRLAVETGSPDVLLTSALVSELALPVTGGSSHRLDSLRMGEALIRDLVVGRNDAFAPLGVDGVLGLDAYRDLLLTVDYPGARLVLSRGSLPAGRPRGAAGSAGRPLRRCRARGGRGQGDRGHRGWLAGQWWVGTRRWTCGRDGWLGRS
ncbi:MAG TPA: hypothetical protein VEB59_07185 [Gemmatimonadales bacterium]|nr:hypothetical protein [Gemmatimonadales bacterium]